MSFVVPSAKSEIANRLSYPVVNMRSHIGLTRALEEVISSAPDGSVHALWRSSSANAARRFLSVTVCLK
jgi:hypothetical protein